MTAPYRGGAPDASPTGEARVARERCTIAARRGRGACAMPPRLRPGLRPALLARAEAANAARAKWREAKGRGCAPPGV
jgi:hypothetical protein